MKQWKLALSLAMVAAVAAPFVTRTFRADPRTAIWVPLTPEQKIQFARIVEQTNNCRAPNLIEEKDKDIFDVDPELSCAYRLNALKEGGVREFRFSTSEYLAMNSVVTLGAFVVVFGLVMVIPAVFRAGRKVGQRYWHWLNT
jgi:hypothetical protein